MRNSLDNKSVAKLQELLEVSADILIGLAIERAGMHHRNFASLDLEIFSSSTDIRLDRDIVGGRSREIPKSLLSHGVESG